MAAKPITAVKSVNVIQSRHGTPQETLKVFAINEGTWGDKISIKIEDSNPADRFNLAVFYKDTPVEVFEDLYNFHDVKAGRYKNNIFFMRSPRSFGEIGF